MKELGRGGVQAYLREQVESHGGMMEHFTSPGKRGVPDVLITWPGARMDLVETKAPGKKPRRNQERDHRERAKYGVDVKVLDTKQKIDEYVFLRWVEG